MAFTEDLDLFLIDFGVPVTAGAVSGIGVLDMPSEVVANGMILMTDYRLTVKASQFGGLLYGDNVTVQNAAYQVRETRLLDDGAFAEISLHKLDFNNIITLSGLNLTTLAGDPLITL